MSAVCVKIVETGTKIRYNKCDITNPAAGHDLVLPVGPEREVDVMEHFNPLLCITTAQLNLLRLVRSCCA